MYVDNHYSNQGNLVCGIILHQERGHLFLISDVIALQLLGELFITEV